MKKKVISYMIVALCIISTVAAGAINGLEYKDKSCRGPFGMWCNDKTRSIDGQGVDINADTLGDFDSDGLLAYSRSQDDTQTQEIHQYINSQRTEGCNEDYILEIFYLGLEQVQYQQTIYTLTTTLDEANDRIDYLTARLDHPKASVHELPYLAALIKSERIGQPVTVNGRVCNAFSGVCVTQQ